VYDVIRSNSSPAKENELLRMQTDGTPIVVYSLNAVEEVNLGLPRNKSDLNQELQISIPVP